MRHLLMVITLFGFVAAPVYAQRDRETNDRLDRRLIDEIVRRDAQRAQGVAPQAEVAQPVTNNLYVKVAATDVDGAVSPAATIGIQRNDEQHPLFAEVAYKYRAGVDANHNNFTFAGMYQFWTGSGKFAPLLQADASESIRPGSNQVSSADITGEISIGDLSLDAVAGYSRLRPHNGDSVSDFVPGVSAYYSLSSVNLLGIDYTFDNDVDEEDSFDVSFRRKLGNGYAVDVVVYKHGDVRLRFRKNFGPLRSR